MDLSAQSEVLALELTFSTAWQPCDVNLRCASCEACGSVFFRCWQSQKNGANPGQIVQSLQELASVHHPVLLILDDLDSLLIDKSGPRVSDSVSWYQKGYFSDHH